MYMGFVCNILTRIKLIRMDPFLSMSRSQELKKIAHELARVIRYVSSGVVSDNDHLSNMRLGLDVAFKTVFIATLLFADLAVPSESLEPLGLLLV
jgi:hypothetical protein